jgi:hypothetical protein
MLFFMGVFEVDGAAYPLFGLQAAAIAQYIAQRREQRHAEFDALRVAAHPDLRGKRPYVESLRHEYYVKGDVYERALKEAAALLRE